MTRNRERDQHREQGRRRESVPAGPLPGRDLRSEPQLRPRAGRRPRRLDGCLSGQRRCRRAAARAGTGRFSAFTTTGLTMGYFDGNTVTALWNYAQHFAMSDNSYGTTFGPSTPGALNLVSGQTNGVTGNINGTGAVVTDGNGGTTDIGDADPLGDVCSTTTGEVFGMTGQNIGDLLNAAGVTLGILHPGFRPRRHQRQRDHRLQPQHHVPGHRIARRPTTSRITSRSNTTNRPQTSRTRGQLPSPASATATPPITSTTCMISTMPSWREISPPSVF